MLSQLFLSTLNIPRLMQNKYINQKQHSISTRYTRIYFFIFPLLPKKIRQSAKSTTDQPKKKGAAGNWKMNKNRKRARYRKERGKVYREKERKTVAV